MPTHIALLRAVNVGGRFYKMAALREHLIESGLQDVETYIQSGNVRFRSAMRSQDKVERHVEEVLGRHCGFEVPAIILSPAELGKVYADATAIEPPAPETEPAPRRYVIFLKPADVPAREEMDRIAAWEHPGESAVVIGRAVHVRLDHPLHEAKFFGALKKVIGPGTNRDLKVVKALAERWGA